MIDNALSAVGQSEGADQWPPWVIWHVPHDATVIPEPWHTDFLLDSEGLAGEILRMTDHHTDALLCADEHPECRCRAPVSRLLVDVERFPDDGEEPMAARGMGVVYTHGSHRQRIREQVDAVKRDVLLETYYWPHHRRLERLVGERLAQYGKVLVIDCHSFPSAPQPYELDRAGERPEICIGTDPLHTPANLVSALRTSLAAHGFSTALNTPFAGALVPLRYYRHELSVASVMIEVRRDLYIDERTGARLPGFQKVRSRIAAALTRAIWESE